MAVVTSRFGYGMATSQDFYKISKHILNDPDENETLENKSASQKTYPGIQVGHSRGEVENKSVSMTHIHTLHARTPMEFLISCAET